MFEIHTSISRIIFIVISILVAVGLICSGYLIYDIVTGLRGLLRRRNNSGD